MAVSSSYSTLLTTITDYLARSDLSTFAPNFVQNFEEKFYRQPKNFGRWMETALSSAIASNVVALPTGYLGLKYAYVNGSPSTRLERVSLDQLFGRYPRGGATARPCWIARELENFVFGPEPDSTYTIKGVYWAKPTVMRSYAADAAAHWLIVNAPDLCLYGALLEAEPFCKNDARFPLWKTMYDLALKDYRDLFTEEESGQMSQEVLA
jgi:hypothetical protein